MLRWLTLGAVALVVGVPALGPALGALGALPRDPGRVAGLTATTLALAGLAAAVALVPGVGWGLGLARGGRAGWVVVAAGAALPLSVQAVAWQAASGGLVDWVGRAPGDLAAWRPWREGLLPAAFVHGMAGVPAVAALVGLALRSADPRLVELALVEGGWARAARRVLLPRAALGALCGGAWVAIQAATEIPVTDAMLVRTAAEEVYTQFATQTGGERAAAALALPFALLAWAGLGLVAWRVGPRLARPGPAGGGDPFAALPGGLRRAASLAGLVAALAAAGVPLTALVARAANGGGVAGFAGSLAAAVRTEGPGLAGSFGAALAAGCLTALLAASAAWGARLRPGSARLWVAFALFVAVTPGPVVGFGLQTAIGWLLDIEDALTGPGVLRAWLYTGPSPVPAVWAGVARFFPVALAVCLPAARLVPGVRIEQARLDGLGAWGVLRRVAWPALGGPALAAALGVAALTLGEVSATRLVDPPGRAPFGLRLFAQMHYGAESAVAALALVQVAAAALVAALVVPGRREVGQRVGGQ